MALNSVPYLALQARSPRSHASRALDGASSRFRAILTTPPARCSQTFSIFGRCLTLIFEIRKGSGDGGRQTVGPMP